MNMSHQFSGLYTGSQLHLGLILKYYSWYINHSMGEDLHILHICLLNIKIRSLGLHQLEIPRVHSKHGEYAFSYFCNYLLIILISSV